MKKIISILLVLCMAIGFCACSSNNNNKVDTGYKNLIYNNKEQVLQSLNIPKKDIEEMKDGIIWKLPNTQKHFNYDFSEYLIFNSHSDTLYGYWYVMDFDKQDEKALDTYKDILSQITKEKGEAQTYIGLDNKFSNISNPLEKLSSDEKAHFIESWYIDKEKNFVLDVELQKFGKDKTTLSVKYSIQVTNSISTK